MVLAEVPLGTWEQIWRKQPSRRQSSTIFPVAPHPCSHLSSWLWIHKPSLGPSGPCLPGGTQGLSRLSLSPPQTSQGRDNAQRRGDKPSPQRRGAILNKELPPACPDPPWVVLPVRLVTLRLSVLGGPWLPKGRGWSRPVGCCGQRCSAAQGVSVLLRTSSAGEGQPLCLPSTPLSTRLAMQTFASTLRMWSKQLSSCTSPNSCYPWPIKGSKVFLK